MAYDFEKYRAKRDKVLGVRRRGFSFGTWAALVSLCILLGLGGLVIPKAVAFFSTRHLDDAIFKLKSAESWPREILPQVLKLAGVKAAVADQHGNRIVITFDKTVTDPQNLAAYFKQSGLETVVLNRLSHGQRLSIMKKEMVHEAL